MVIPSWYVKYHGDPSGSFFREQSLALSKLVSRVGVLVVETNPLHSILRKRNALSKIETYRDDFLYIAKISSYNFTPRFERGILFQWEINGLRLFSRYIQEYGLPDVIQAHCSLYGGYLAYLISKKFGIPYIVTEHSSYFMNDGRSNFKNKIAEIVFSNSHANISVSLSLKQAIEKKVSGCKEFQVISNVIHDSFFSIDIPEIIEKKKIKIVNIGLLVDVKNQASLIQAIYELKKNGFNNICLDIIGDGPLRNNLINKVKQLALEDSVNILGERARNEIPNILVSSDIFVLSSHYETFGVVVAEALSVGLPCIVTPCGGPVEFVSENDGVIAHSVCPQDIAHAIEKTIIANDFNNYSLKQERRSRAKLKFSSDVIGSYLLKLLSEAIKAKN